jgi:hypothetical protein
VNFSTYQGVKVEPFVIENGVVHHDLENWVVEVDNDSHVAGVLIDPTFLDLLHQDLLGVF